MKFLVTGGAGYIGSHVCVELIESGHQVVVFDNLSNSKESTLQGIAKITNSLISKKPSLDGSIFFYKSDVRDSKALQRVFLDHEIDAVFHFAGDKAVSESVENPIQYYNNGVLGIIVLLETMRKFNIKTIIYSSSATVYGNPKSVPIKEGDDTGRCSNPYGRSKYFSEEILKDLCVSDSSWNVAILRYFNPVGAHYSSIIGEDPKETPANLMPYISQVACGKLAQLKIFGDDYPTVDGTGVRDYIHVVDLAKGHIAALNALTLKKGMIISNLGTGKGVSVLTLVKEFERVNRVRVPYVITGRRKGDIAECWTSTEYAEKHLKWSAEYDIEKMCTDEWNWQCQNI